MAHVLFIEPFYGGSHRSFLDGLVASSRHQFTLFTLPGSEWRKRMRLGAQQLAKLAGGVETQPDLLIASDMLDLPAFLALTRPRFSSTPVLLYMHENQFTYPRIRGTKLNSWFGQINYMSALAATAVAFNSEYHRREFLDALRQLTDEPTNWLDPEAIELIEAKSSTLPVGVELRWMDGARPETRPDGPPLILWNHRWEFDKAPAMFVRTLETLATDDVAFRVAVAGEPGDNPHPSLVSLPDALGDRVIHHGHLAARTDYAGLLWEADLVVSTARHEFFGVSTVEAMYCECVPVLPNGLNYPFLVPDTLHESCLYDNEADLVAKLRSTILGHRPDVAALRTAAAGYDWSIVAEVWDQAIERMVGGETLG